MVDYPYLPVVHVTDPETGEYLGNVPAGEQFALQKLRGQRQKQRKAAAGLRVDPKQQRDLELNEQARFALDQPWYLADQVAALAEARLNHGALLTALHPLPDPGSGDLSIFGPDYSRFQPNLAPFQRNV